MDTPGPTEPSEATGLTAQPSATDAAVVPASPVEPDRFDQVLGFVALAASLWCWVPPALARIQFHSRGMHVLHDASAYIGVGRGLLAGLTPYRELLEIKPPGIFLTSAFGFLLPGDGFDNLALIQAFALSVILLAPVLTGLLYRPWSSPWSLALLFSAGAAMTCFTADRVGGYQTETFGVAALVVTACLQATAPTVPRRWWNLATGISIGTAVLFKEPFAAVALALSLMRVKSLHGWMRKSGVPLLIGVGWFLFWLLPARSLFSYFGVYLPVLFGGRLSDSMPLLSRGVRFLVAFDNLSEYDRMLYVALGLALVSVVTATAGAAARMSQRAQSLNVLRWAAWLWLVGLSIGVGGHLDNHWFLHAFAVGVPAWMALLMALIALPSESGPLRFARTALVCVWAALLMGAHQLPKPDFAGQATNTKAITRNGKATAAYIEEVLRLAHLERWAYLGGNNGACVYAFTHVPPLGPYFFQGSQVDPNDVDGVNSIRRNAETARLVVVQRAIPFPEYLRAGFSESPWPEVAHLPKPQEADEYIILFRNP